MEDKNNILYVTLIIVSISLIGIIASSYYFQVNDNQKRVISLYESQKFQEKSEKEKKARLAKKKQELLAKKNKQELEDKKNKSKEESTKLASKSDKNLQRKHLKNSHKSKVINKKKFIANSQNKPTPKPKSSTKKSKTKKNKKSEKCDKVKKYCPITKPPKEPTAEKTSEVQENSTTNVVSNPNLSNPNIQNPSIQAPIQEQSPQKNYIRNTPTYSYSYSNQPVTRSYYYNYSYSQVPQNVTRNRE